MADNPIVSDGVVYQDEAAFTVLNHPHIPDEIKKLYTAPTMPPGGSTEPAGALKSQGGTKVAPQEITNPEASYSNPPERSSEPSIINRPSVINAVKGMLNGPNLEEDEKILSSFYNTVKNAFSLVGDVYNGKIDPMSEQGIERAHDLAGLMVMGPAPVAAKLADGTLGSFAGVKAAKSMDKINDLGHAQILEAQGLHPDTIFHDTGYFRGPDNRWRFEIGDKEAKFKPDWYNQPPKPAYTPADSSVKLEDDLAGLFKSKKWEQVPFDFTDGKVSTTLGEILDHPDLYKAYPQLENMPVIKDTSVKTAHYDPNNNTIVIGPEKYNTKSTVMHEVQHAIQGIEGFAQGGSWGVAGKSYQLKLADDFNKQVKIPLQQWRDKITSGQKDLIITKADADEIKRLRLLAEKYKEYSKAGDAKAYENYLNLAGEVESRNVEARLNMADDKRRIFPPTWTQDIEDTVKPIVSMKPVVTTPYGIKTD